MSTMAAITEPMTLATDLVLGTFAIALSLRLRKRTEGQERYAARWWALALFFAGLAAIVGGCWHGFTEWLSPLTAWVLWRITVWSVGAGGCAMLLGTIQARIPRARRQPLRILALAQFAIYAGWMLFHHEFIFVIIDYGLAMVVVLLVHGWAWVRSRRTADGWILAGVAVSVVAAAVQALELAPHPHFNHNDLYHVIQMVGLWCFFSGGSHLHDSDSPQEP